MDELAPGQLLRILANDPAAEEDIKRWAKRAGHALLEFRESRPRAGLRGPEGIVDHAMPDKKKIVYLQTSGTDTPERLYAPFILATTAAAMGQEPIVYFFIKGVTAVKKGEAEKIRIGEFPSLSDVIDQAVEAGVKLMVCEQSCMLLGLDRATSSSRRRWWAPPPSTISCSTPTPSSACDGGNQNREPTGPPERALPIWRGRPRPLLARYVRTSEH